LVPLEMSTIDIEAPGADEAALKAALQALVPISTTTISSPVNYVDITLPSGYSGFRLSIIRLKSVSGWFQGAYSQDGGATWLENFNGDYNAYAATVISRLNTLDSYTELSGIFDLVIAAGSTFLPYHIDMLIDPGSASVKAHHFLSSSGTSTTAATGGIAFIRATCRINTARVNTIRIMNAGEDPAAPAGNDLESGTFTLYGIN
jgi:hypothetical protein